MHVRTQVEYGGTLILRLLPPTLRNDRPRPRQQVVGREDRAG